MVIVRHRFRKAPFSKCFPSTQKRKAGVFKFLCFRDGLVWIGPNRCNKAAFSNFPDVMGTLPNAFFLF